MKKSVSLGIVGLGGEGVVILGTLLLKVGSREFYHGKMQKFYDARIKGGSSAVFLSFSLEKEILPSENLDILVCLNGKNLKEFRAELPIVSQTLFFLDDIPENRPIFNEYSNALPFPFEKICREKGATLQSKNMVALGVLSRILGFDKEEVIEEIKKFSKKYEEQNLACFEAGLEFSETSELPSWQLLKPIPPQRDPAKGGMPGLQKIIIDGNEAVVQAALKVACTCLIAYPITPASEIMESLGPKLLSSGKVFVQAEDEIAAAGLCIGASLGGAKSMVSTSGPGLDLLMEMLGLASQAEIPLVIVDVQRAGPATGMPTKTEQSDLFTAIYGGHGDTPRVVLAPYDTEGCYRLTIEAFNISEYYQTPVILLSDQNLGQTLVSTCDFTSKNYQIIERLKPDEKEKGNYRRYIITPNFISPFAIFGTPGFCWQTSGLTHQETGAPASESAELQQKMAEKRWKKLLPLTKQKDLVKTFGNPKSKIGIMSWGSSAKTVLESLQEQGLLSKVKVCIPELLHPLPEEEIQSFLKNTKKLCICELNYSGQFARHLRAWIDLPKNTRIYSRAGGSPFTRSELKDWLSEVVK